jgi:hypothetical protein
MPLTRHVDWRPRLVAYLAEIARQPFAPGRNDCALFLAGGVLAMTGEDFAAPFRGRYTTPRGGLRVLRKAGFEDHVALAAHHLSERPVASAREGDGAVIPTRDGPALGIVQGAGIYGLGPDGLVISPLLSAERVFEV